MTGDFVKRVGFEVGTAFVEIKGWLDPVLVEIRFGEGLDTGGDGLIGKDDDRRGILAGEAAGLEGGVEAVFDIARGEDDAWGIAVRAVDGLHEVGLFDRSRQSGGGATSLDVDDDEGDLGHASVTDGFRFQREAGSG